MYYGQFNPPVDQVIEGYFPKGYIGNAIDIGAVDGVFISNTLYFEKLGWNVLCIEPNPYYIEDLQQNRRYTMPYAVSDKDEDGVPFHVVKVTRKHDNYVNYSSISALEIDRSLIDLHQTFGLECEEIEVKVSTRRLDTCLDEFSQVMTMRQIDFVSIDTEGTELNVLKGFNIDFWKPTLFIIESNDNERSNAVRNFMESRDYRLDQRLEVNDFYVRI
jgi:FkbM family methyltransferase